MHRLILLLFLSCIPSIAAVNCGPGQFSNDTINCYNCSANTYCQGGVVTPCPQYSTSPAGSSNITQCSCQANSVLNNGACMCIAGYILDSQSKCVQCPANMFCPDQFTKRNCTNYALSLPGSSGPESCNACPVGYVQNSDTTAPISCRACYPGSVCPNRTTEIACKAGTYAPTLGTACVQCQANTYAIDSASSCSS